MKLEFIDIRRAYYQAEARRDLYVQLPPEDRTPGMCGKLNKALQGTRDAAQCWEYECTTFVESLHFTRGKCSPCTFYHRARNLWVAIHGDDFTLLGTDQNLDWFRTSIQAKWQVKVKGRLGPGPQDTKVIHVLNRLVEWREDGTHYEADQRHPDILVKTLSLDSNAKGSAVPGTSDEVDL